MNSELRTQPSSQGYDLIDISTRPDHLELSRKGGKSTSKRKVMASRINGLKASPSMSPEKMYYLTMLEDGNYYALISELLSYDVQDLHVPETRHKILNILVKLVPAKHFNVTVNPDRDIFASFSEKYQEYKRRKENGF